MLERTRLEKAIQEMIDEVITSYIEMAAAEKGRRQRELRKATTRPLRAADHEGHAGHTPRLE